MTLRDAIDQYIAWRRAHGAEFRAQTYLLKLFLKSVDGNVHCDAIATAQVRAFLAGKTPLTQYRSHKYSTLAGFYRYAISRGHATRSPLPAPENEPKAPPSAPRHVYSHDELRCLFSAIDASRSRALKLDAYTFRTLLPASVWNRYAVERGNAPHDGRCRSFGRRAHRTQYEVLQEPPRPGRAPARQCTKSLCRVPCGTSCPGREGIILSGKPGRNTIGKKDRPERVYRSAFRCRGSRYSWQTTITVPSFAASQLRHTPGNSLVQARSRCTAAAADALHLSRSCGLGRHTSLPVDDTGTIARGLVAPGAFRRRRER